MGPQVRPDAALQAFDLLSPPDFNMTSYFSCCGTADPVEDLPDALTRQADLLSDRLKTAPLCAQDPDALIALRRAGVHSRNVMA